jgi:streptogramin lyase
VSDTPGRITQGPDGNIWVLLGGANEIAKITPAGVKTEYDVADLAAAVGLTAGPDGNLWATKAMAVVKVPPANPAGATLTAIADLTDPQDIVSGPGGNLWAPSADKLFKIPPGAPATATKFDAVFTGARGIAAGGDGNLWVADNAGERVARVTPAGTPTYFAVGPGLQGIAAGPGTQVAATQPNAAATSLARIAPGGTAQKTLIGAVDPFGITLASDGAYWVAQFNSPSLGRLTPAGAYTKPITLPANSGARRIARGPNNTLWVSLETSKKVAVVRGVDPALPGGGGVGTTTPDKIVPGLAAASMTDRTVVVGSGATPRTGSSTSQRRRRRIKTGTTIRYRLTEAATVRLRFERVLAGRRVRRKCVAPKRRYRKRRKCRRYKHAGTLVRTSKVGRNSVKFTGRIGRKALKRGRYRLVLRATDAAGNRSRVRRIGFRVVKRPKRR